MEPINSAPEFIVFLDFDGVLHPLEARDHERFKPDAIRSVNSILDELGANIVLSTAWRIDFGIEKFNPWFKGRILGATPIQELNLKLENPRFHEVMAFLRHREWLNVPWIAIDDKRGHFPVWSPAYITDPKTGITARDVEYIIQIGKSMKFAQKSLSDHINRSGYGQ
ncbi:MAG: HAD domain-containing protein [Gammaproteobacteria bacterium]